MILRKIKATDRVAINWIGFGVKPIDESRCVVICVYRENIKETIDLLNGWKEIAVNCSDWIAAGHYRDEVDRLKKQKQPRLVFETSCAYENPEDRFNRYKKYYADDLEKHCIANELRAFISEPCSISHFELINAFPDAKWHFGN